MIKKTYHSHLANPYEDISTRKKLVVPLAWTSASRNHLQTVQSYCKANRKSHKRREAKHPTCITWFSMRMWNLHWWQYLSVSLKRTTLNSICWVNMFTILLEILCVNSPILAISNRPEILFGREIRRNFLDTSLQIGYHDIPISIIGQRSCWGWEGFI